VRFKDASGGIQYGDLKQEAPSGNWKGVEVDVLEGDIDSGWKSTGKKENIAEVRISRISQPWKFCRRRNADTLRLL
jgi:hypothetical protein